MTILICEMVGTAMLILLGDGVVANVLLNKSNMKGAGPVQITIAWGLAVLIPAYIFDASSGAHFNPALSIALMIDGTISFGQLFLYIIGQMVGAFIGAVLVFIMFYEQFKATDDPLVKRACFCTSPAVPNRKLNLLSEIIGTFVLVFAIKGIGNVAGAGEQGLNYFFVFAIIVSVGMSLGGLTGYAINPARDLGPRIAHYLLPIPGKGDSGFDYAIVPVVGPIIGAVAAIVLFKIIPW